MASSHLPMPLIAVVIQSHSCVRLFASPWTIACQASLSSTISRNLLKFMSTESMMPSNIPSSATLFFWDFNIKV